MLDINQIATASRTLVSHWRAGSKLQNLDAAERPTTRADGYAIQAEIERISHARLFGWKIAATSEAGQKHINVPGPMAGRILQDTLIAERGIALAWLANELSGLGITLRAGEVVTTGTCHPPLPIASGDRMEADFGVLGKVSVGFA